jgi:Na+/H+-dicarboxylate symporter
MKRRFTLFVFGSMVLGVLVGFVMNQTMDAGQVKTVAGYYSIATDIFLRLIKMIIGPLVFSTLVVGIAHMEDTAAIGRVGGKTMGWFIFASLVSLAIGLIMVHLLQPGVGLGLPLPEATAKSGVEAANLTLRDFITHLIPTSIFDALARNEILQIVVFALFVGSAISALDDRAPALVHLAELVAQVMLKITGYVMSLAPIAIFAALASTVATQGIAILATYAKFVGGFYFSLAVLWALLGLATFLAVGRRVGALVGEIRHPILLAFSTASSEAAYPRTLEGLQNFGVSRKIASFVLPLGYSFNLDGSTMYCTFATLFIAQAYGIPLSLGQQLVMILLLMITSKGMAGVPRASLVVIAATLTYFKLPEAGLLLILAVDHLLDMGRSATNVVGNSVASVLVGKWEGQLSEGSTLPEPAE